MSTLKSVQEVSQELNLSVQRVRELCRNGDILANKIGNSWAIDDDCLREYGLSTSCTVAEDHKAYEVSATKPVALSFFSGAMGLDLGLESAGFDIRLSCEVDKFCRQTIELNKPEIALLGDINEYDAKKIIKYSNLKKKTDIDLIIGGPPCQAFSTAGKRLGLNDVRGNVFLKYIEIAIDIRPKFIVIENVRGLLSCPMKHRPHNKRGNGFPDLKLDELRGGALNFILSLISNAGYSYSFNLYNAANYGSPQIRERVIIICSRKGQKIPYLPPTHSEKGDFGLKKWKTFKSATKDIRTHSFINFPEKRLKYYKMLKAGQNWRSLPIELQKEALGKSFYAGGGKTGFLRRLSWNKPSPTLVTHPAMPATDLAHPEENRPLSVEEYKKLQEFPDHWKIVGPLVQQYKQIGNAVPHSLGKALGILLIKTIRYEDIREVNNFSYSRYKNTNEKDWMQQFEKNRIKNQNIEKQMLLFN